MAVSTTSGTRIYIAAEVVDLDDLKILNDADAVAFFETLTWTEIGEVESYGDLGDTSETATFTAVTDRRTRKFKTSRDAGTMPLIVGRDPQDPGQIMLNDAEADDYEHAFQIEYADARDDENTDSVEYYAGQVTSKATNLGTVQDVTKKTFNLGVNTKIYEVVSEAIAAPTNSVIPSISGLADVPAQLTAIEGLWNNAVSFTYRWQADAAGNGVFADISAATARKYTLTAGEVGDMVRVGVTGVNSAGTLEVFSAPTAIVVA